MDMNPKFAHRFHIRKRQKGDTAQLAAQLAPLEEQNKPPAQAQGGTGQPSVNTGASQEYGAIVVSNAAGNLSQDIMESSGAETFLGMEPVVIVILGVMLAFIAFIAWQISLMPAQ
jgi:hypothetical protein